MEVRRVALLRRSHLLRNSRGEYIPSESQLDSSVRRDAYSELKTIK